MRGDSTHLDGAALVWAAATAARDGIPAAPLAQSRAVMSAVVSRPRSVLVVALDDDRQVAAFAVAAPAAEASIAEVEFVGVRPGAWGAGLGRGVLGQLCSELAADGFRQAQLLVYTSNRRAVALYEGRGWQPDGAPQPQPRPANLSSGTAFPSAGQLDNGQLASITSAGPGSGSPLAPAGAWARSPRGRRAGRG